MVVPRIIQVQFTRYFEFFFPKILLENGFPKIFARLFRIFFGDFFTKLLSENVIRKFLRNFSPIFWETFPKPFFQNFIPYGVSEKIFNEIIEKSEKNFQKNRVKNNFPGKNLKPTLSNPTIHGVTT